MNTKDLKFIQKELHEAYEMEDKILIGYAINRLDNLIFEETQQLQKGSVANVGGWKIKHIETSKVIEIETTCLEDGLIVEACKYQDGVRIGSGACSMCEFYMKGSKLDLVNDIYLTRCSKYTEEQAKSQNLKYLIV